MRKIVTVSIVLALLSGQTQAQASLLSSIDVNSAEVQQAQAKKGGFILKRKLDDLKIDGKKKSLAGKTEIAAPFFRLNFVTDGKYRNSDNYGLHRSTSKLKSTLSGVDGGTLQRLTDEMYHDFTAQLAAAGYEVMDNSVITQSEKYKKLDNDYPQIKKDVVKATPSGMTFPGKFRNPSPALSEETGALILQLDLNVDFLIINQAKRFDILKDGSYMGVTQGISVFGTVTVYSKNKVTLITLQQPVTSSRPFGALNDETSALSKANDALVFASGWLSPQGLGSKRQTHKSVDVVANPEQYRLAVGDALVQVNRKIAEALKELRDR